MAGLAHGGVADGTRLEAEVGYGLPVGSRFVGTRVPTRFVLKYTLRLAHLELGGVDLDIAVEDDVLPLDRADMTKQVGVERESPERRQSVRDLPGLPVDDAGEDSGSDTSRRSPGRRPRAR